MKPKFVNIKDILYPKPKKEKCLKQCDIFTFPKKVKKITSRK